MSSENSFNPELVTGERARILVVDDNEDLLKLMSLRLRPLKYRLRTATTAEEALSILAIWPADLVITDLELPNMSGMELFENLHRTNPYLPVIILTAHGSIPDAVAATLAGVASYLTKPFDSDELVQKINIALFNSGFQEAETIHTDYLMQDNAWRENFISGSPKMKAVLSEIENVAETDDLVVLEGENGVGKDELARALHKRSFREPYPLIEINCSHYTKEVLEAEIFGIAADPNKGISARVGRLREANEGSILFRDYHEIPLSLLQKILSAFTHGKASTINSTETYEFDVRPIGTGHGVRAHSDNNPDLWDLCHILGLALIDIPPLRERREDIALLVNHTLAAHKRTSDAQFSPAAMRLLIAADWPGNTQHLINVVRQCARLTTTNIISETLVASKIESPMFRIQPLTSALREFERGYLTEVLKATKGNVTKASNMAKRNRTELHRLLKKHHIEAKSFRNNK